MWIWVYLWKHLSASVLGNDFNYNFLTNLLYSKIFFSILKWNASLNPWGKKIKYWLILFDLEYINYNKFYLSLVLLLVVIVKLGSKNIQKLKWKVKFFVIRHFYNPCVSLSLFTSHFRICLPNLILLLLISKPCLIAD